MKYITTVVSVSVHPDTSHPIFGDGIIKVSLEDEAGGFFFKLEQEGNSITINPEELPIILEAAKKLLDCAPKQ